MKTSVCCWLAMLGAFTLPVSADIVNGMFLPGGSGSFQTVNGVDGSTITGWTVAAGGSVDWMGTYWQAPPTGGYSIDLDGNSQGAIYQDIATTVGQLYYLTFWLAGNPDGPPDPKTVRVSADSVYADFQHARPPSLTDLGWTQETFSFTASDATTRITFASLDPGFYGAVIGDVRVSTPEPVSVVMLLGMLISVAVARRLRLV